MCISPLFLAREPTIRHPTGRAERLITLAAYSKFVGLNIDTAPLGVELGENASQYFCTPKGARIIGWAGVDGIHFCFIPGYGETVFAVNPMNLPGHYVHPLARNFSDFLRLLMACPNAAALQQIHGWTRPEFDSFLENNLVSEEQSFVLSVIAERLHLEAMKCPFAYVKAVQTGFDYSSIKFTDGYKDIILRDPKPPQWKVYFDGDFLGRGHPAWQRPGKETPINAEFILNNRLWHIPSVYSCGKGLVIDFCVRIPAESIRGFVDKWNLSSENDGRSFGKRQEMQMRAENPMSIDVSLEITVNGKKTPSVHGCGLSWNPCLPDLNSVESKGVLEQYKLDPSWGWAVWRAAFPWATSRKPQISSTSVTVKHDAVEICGPHFRVSTLGESVHFVHPASRAEHSLTVHGYRTQEIPMARLEDQNREYPTHCTVMNYSVHPDLPGGSFSVHDSGDGDGPRQTQVHSNGPSVLPNCCAVGIIGGAAGPTSVLVSDGEKGKLRTACSALYFDRTHAVEWQMVFREKPCANMTVKII